MAPNKLVAQARYCSTDGLRVSNNNNNNTSGNGIPLVMNNYAQYLK